MTPLMTDILNHWSLVEDSRIYTLTINQSESSTNTLSESVLEELDKVLIEIESSQAKNLIIKSEKSNGFIAGANIKDFQNLSNVHETSLYINKVHKIFNRLESLPFPSIAVIHGFCLGGGLELALACDYRIAREDLSQKDKCYIGFPEVKLGIFPGFGGSVRSIKTIGHLKALNLMLSARVINAKQSQKMGLIDLVLPERQLNNGLDYFSKKLKRGHLKLPFYNKIIGSALIRPVIARYMEKMVNKRVDKKHYPAPFELIKHWQRYANDSKRMYENEANQVAKLLNSAQSQNLIRTFLLQEKLKHQTTKDKYKFKHVHVIGGGIMGGDIAAWCVLQGLTVTLQDRKPEYLTKTIQRAHGLFKKKNKNNYLSRDCIDRLIVDCEGYGVKKADIVIEAVFEDLDAKKSVFSIVEPQLKEGALLLTNTSSIPLEDLSKDLKHPNKLVGLHFFNPVAKMQLVEIVKTPNTDQECLNRVIAFTLRIKKLPLPVLSSPGFLVNRVLMPYLIEAVICVEEGISPEVIDKAATDFGMPMGPIELADTVGLDICLSVAEKMTDTLKIDIPNILKNKVRLKELGKKTGSGFYRYKSNKIFNKGANKSIQSDNTLINRLVLRLINECVACLRENIVDDADLLDAGVIYGTGFAPFLGGPLNYIEQQGKQNIIMQLNEAQKNYHDDFKPDVGWLSE